jgi:hypothetical protein
MKPRLLSSLLLACIAVSLACAQSTPLIDHRLHVTRAELIG